MPKSRVRRKKSEIYTPPPPTTTRKKKTSPRWYGPLVLFFLVFGVAWLTASYMTGTDAPLLGDLGNWNILVGFGFIATGFGLATNWR